MEIKSSWVKALTIGGIVVISIGAILIDFTAGKDIAMIGLVGLVGLTKGE